MNKIKKKYKIEVSKHDHHWGINIKPQIFFNSEAEAWQWVEDNFPLPDIEAIKKKWQKEKIKLVELLEWAEKDLRVNDANQFAVALVEIEEFLTDLGEK